MDWKPLIVEMVLIKQTMAELDTEHIWKYHLPRVAATDDELVALEAYLGEPLDPAYRAFLHYAGGWPAFYQTVDLFGPTDFLTGDNFRHALDLLSYLEEVVLMNARVCRDDLLPIAATMVDLDLFVLTRPSSPAPGQVIWFAGGEIDRFPSFNDYFLAMLEYNRLGMQQLREKTAHHA